MIRVEEGSSDTCLVETLRDMGFEVYTPTQAEIAIAKKLQSLGFAQVCEQEPTTREMEPDEEDIFPIEWAKSVWKRDNDREFVVISISRCLSAAHEPLIRIDASGKVAHELVESGGGEHDKS